MSRRAEIRLSPDEQRELISSHRTLIVSSIGPRGWPHVMPMWFTLRESASGADEATGTVGEFWIWTYAKSQKVKNLERDPRATLLVETGGEYQELRGIQIESEAEIIRELDRVLEFGIELTVRYTEGIDSIGDDAADAMRAQAAKRVAIRFEPRRVATWDHRKLGGTY